MHIRPATLDDDTAASRVLAAAYSTLLKPDYDAETLARIVPLISKAKPELLASGTWFVAEIGGKVVACGGWTPDKPGSGTVVPGLGHIRHVAADPAFTRRGIAGALLRHAIAGARAAGATRLECLSTRTAVPFYAANGFVVRREIDLQIASIPFPSVDMVLNMA